MARVRPEGKLAGMEFITHQREDRRRSEPTRVRWEHTADGCDSEQHAGSGRWALRAVMQAGAVEHWGPDAQGGGLIGHCEHINTRLGPPRLETGQRSCRYAFRRSLQLRSAHELPSSDACRDGMGVNSARRIPCTPSQPSGDRGRGGQIKKLPARRGRRHPRHLGTTSTKRADTTFG